MNFTLIALKHPLTYLTKSPLTLQLPHQLAERPGKIRRRPVPPEPRSGRRPRDQQQPTGRADGRGGEVEGLPLLSGHPLHSRGGGDAPGLRDPGGRQGVGRVQAPAGGGGGQDAVLRRGHAAGRYLHRFGTGGWGF